jgi:hypothetical protein
VFSIIGLTSLLQKKNAIIKEKKENLNTLQVGITHFRASDSLSAAKIGVLSQSTDDLKRYNADILEQLETLDISVRKLKTAIKTSTVTEFNKHTVLRDSVVQINDSVVIRISSYKDDWLEFYHSFRNNQSDSLHIKVKSDIDNFIYWDREGFWPTRWLKRKNYYLVSKTNNPYVVIDSLKFIECSKK